MTFVKTLLLVVWKRLLLLLLFRSSDFKWNPFLCAWLSRFSQVFVIISEQEARSCSQRTERQKRERHSSQPDPWLPQKTHTTKQQQKTHNNNHFIFKTRETPNDDDDDHHHYAETEPKHTEVGFQQACRSADAVLRFLLLAASRTVKFRPQRPPATARPSAQSLQRLGGRLQQLHVRARADPAEEGAAGGGGAEAGAEGRPGDLRVRTVRAESLGQVPQEQHAHGREIQ